MAGQWQAAAQAWAVLGCPYERASRWRCRRTTQGADLVRYTGRAVGRRRTAPPSRDAGVRGVARGARASTRSHPLGLTAAEVQVLRLLAAGSRNAQIAEQLHLSVRTVDHHVASVLAKLGAASRQDTVKLAESHGWWGEPPQSGSLSLARRVGRAEEAVVSAGEKPGMVIRHASEHHAVHMLQLLGDLLVGRDAAVDRDGEVREIALELVHQFVAQRWYLAVLFR